MNCEISKEGGSHDRAGRGCRAIGLGRIADPGGAEYLRRRRVTGSRSSRATQGWRSGAGVWRLRCWFVWVAYLAFASSMPARQGRGAEVGVLGIIFARAEAGVRSGSALTE